MGKMIGAAEFKAKCLSILGQVERDRVPVTITKRGRPIAQVTPVEMAERKLVFGCMGGAGLKYERPFDPAVDPEEWDANRAFDSEEPDIEP